MLMLFVPVGCLGPFREATGATEGHEGIIDRGATEINIRGNSVQGREEAMMKTRETELSDNTIIKTEEIIKSINNKADGKRLECFLYTTKIRTLICKHPVDRTGLSQFMERGSSQTLGAPETYHHSKSTGAKVQGTD
jgi:hypothetical protein